MKIGRFREQVILTTDCTNTPTLKLYVIGEAAGTITVTPRNLSLGMIEPDQKTERTLVLRSIDDAFTFNVTDISSTLQGMATELVTVTPGKEYHIIVSLPNGAPQPVMRGNIIINTDAADQETITVRTFGFTPKAPGISRSRKGAPPQNRSNADKQPPL
jgi:hypothetical protein